MTDETEVLRIKREALEGLRDWTRSRVETVRDVTQYLREVLPPHAPRKVPAEIRWVPDGFCRAQGAHSQWEIGYGERSFGVPKHLFARIADLVARADEQGMVEEGLGESADKDRPPDEGATFAPAPSPAPAETREWRVMVDAKGWIMDGRSLGASDVRINDAEYPQDAPHELLDVVPRSSLDAMREERDQFQKAYDAAERHNTILRENVERHGDTIRELRAQLAEAQKERDTLEGQWRVQQAAAANMRLRLARARAQRNQWERSSRGWSTQFDSLHDLYRRTSEKLREATGDVSRETIGRTVEGDKL